MLKNVPSLQTTFVLRVVVKILSPYFQVIVRKNGKLQLLCKGADNVIFERLDKSCADAKEIITHHLNVSMQSLNRKYGKMLETISKDACIWKKKLYILTTLCTWSNGTST